MSATNSCLLTGVRRLGLVRLVGFNSLPLHICIQLLLDGDVRCRLQPDKGGTAADFDVDFSQMNSLIT